MEPSTTLIASAQISVAIAGFAGLAVAFRNDSVREWGEVERFWFRLLLMNSILPLSFSLFGLFLLVILPPPSSIWRWCSGFSVLCLLPHAVSIISNLARFERGQLKASGGSRVTSYALVTILVLVWLLQVWNAAMAGLFWPFYAAILSLVMGSVYQFVRLVLTRQKPDANP